MRRTGPGALTRLAMAIGLALLAAWSMAPAPAQAAPYAAFVMDARTGEVLYSENADTRLHPASLTKMMTLYLAMEAVKQGRLRLDQTVTVSALAARQPPSRIGLKAGQRVTIQNLMRAAAVKSANDAATALAEATAGSIDSWSKMANAKAQILGMRNSTFRNPHGLSQSGHLSTARDMSILGRRMFFDHPEYYNIFSRTQTTAMGKTVFATNRRLLSSYPGADGIKTGYTRDSGFNLVASAHRGDQRVIATVFGARSSSDRTQKISHLLDIGFDRSPRYAKVIPPKSSTAGTVVAKAPLPDERPEPPKSLLAQVGEAIAPAAANAGERVDRGTRYAPRRAAMPAMRPGPAGGAIAGMPLARPSGVVEMAMELPPRRP